MASLRTLYWKLRAAARCRRYFHEQLLVLSKKPPILVVPHDFFDNYRAWMRFFSSLPKTRGHLLVRVRCSLETPAELQKTLYAFSRLHREFPHLCSTFLANTHREENLLRSAGAEVILANQNAFLDEDIFSTYPPSRDKPYKAIYNARPHPCKNFELAAQVQPLALITYFAGHEDVRYFERVREMLPEAVALNWDGSPLKACFPSKHKLLPPRDVAQAISNARVGLCLSTSEGAMYAAGEYLLCGTPVVSTRGIGGRELCFSPDTALLVDETPSAVRQGVERVAAWGLAPSEVRALTLRKMQPHRDRFFNLLDNIPRKAGCAADAHLLLDKKPPNRLYRWQAVKPWEEIEVDPTYQDRLD